MTETEFKSSQKLIRMIANKVIKGKPKSVMIEDLEAFGWIGLLKARVRYDSERNNSFLNFAYLRIRGEMLDSLRRDYWGEERVLGLEGNRATMETFIDPDSVNAFQCKSGNDSVQVKDEFNLYMSYLTDRTQGIIKSIYFEHLTQKQVAIKLGLTESRVSQIVMSAIALLKRIKVSRDGLCY